ncbi:MAG: WD40 repeat domain-containing protein [Planctomycetes bacterium]|nr:WD40 repeat domain-containing protein [Planctomycetota bacterium]
MSPSSKHLPRRAIARWVAATMALTMCSSFVNAQRGFTCVDISANHEYIASYDADHGLVFLHRRSNATPLWSAAIDALYVATCNRGYVVVGEHGNTVHLFDVDGDKFWEYSDPKWTQDEIRVDISDSGRTVAAVNDDPSDTHGSVMCIFDHGGPGWSSSNGTPVCRYIPSPDIGGNDFYTVVMSEDGRYQATGPGQGTTWFQYYAQSCSTVNHWNLGQVQSVDFTDNAEYLAAGNIAGNLYFYDRDQRLWSKTLGARVHAVTAAHVNGTSDSTIVAGTVSGLLRTYDRSGTLLWSDDQTRNIVSVDSEADGGIAVGVYEHSLRFYDRNQGPATQWTASIPISDSGGGNQGTESRTVRISSDGTTIVAACRDGLYVYSAGGQQLWNYSTSARAQSYCGSGINLPCDGLAITPPILGCRMTIIVRGTCQTQTIGGFSASLTPWNPGPVIPPFGEFLVNPSSAAGGFLTLAIPGDPAETSFVIPNDTSLEGGQFFVQGFGADLAQGTIVLHCAYDLLMGN